MQLFLAIAVLAAVLATAAFAWRKARMSAKAAELEAHARMLEDVAAGYVRHFALIEKRIEEAAMLRHDLRNQLSVIDELARSGDKIRAQEMIAQLEGRLDEAGGRVRRPHSTAPAALPAGTEDSGGELPARALRGRRAREVDIAQAREKAAREMLEARSYYVRNLTLEAQQAASMERRLRASIALEKLRLEGKDAGPTDASTVRLIQHFCEHRALDTLLALKADVCDEKGIRFRCAADVPEGAGIESLDLCALFSNAIDNAIAGCEALETGTKKWIRLGARTDARRMVIIIENSCVPGALDARASAKRELEGHGWGLKILEGLVRAHNGEMSIAEHDGTFTVHMLLELQ